MQRKLVAQQSEQQLVSMVEIQLEQTALKMQLVSLVEMQLEKTAVA